MDTQNLPDLPYPWWRDELIDYLGELADPEYQERQWVRCEVIAPNTMEGLDFPVQPTTGGGVSPAGCTSSRS